jgi:hypothetical protein
VTTLTEGKGIQRAVELLQDINATIDGTKYAPDNYPSTMESGYMPCAIILPQSGSSRSLGDLRERIGNFLVRVYVSPTGSDVFDNPIQNSYLLLQKYLQTYLDKITSSEISTILDTGSSSEYRIELISYQQQPIADSGVVSDLQYTREDINFFGFELTLGVIIEWPISCP